MMKSIQAGVLGTLLVIMVPLKAQEIDLSMDTPEYEATQAPSAPANLAIEDTDQQTAGANVVDDAEETDQEVPQQAIDAAPSLQQPEPLVYTAAPAANAPLSVVDAADEPENDDEEEVADNGLSKQIDYGEGVDTLNVSGSGNWLLKRVWWEKGQAKFESIKSVLEKIFDARMDFFFKRSAIDKELNAFYLDIGFAQGELDEIVAHLIEIVERHANDIADDQERKMLAVLQRNKKELEQLKQDIAAVAELDEAIDTALTQMIDQINKSRKYEHDAWLRFKAIAQEIDDEKARELYYHMETLLANMQDVFNYLRGDFTNYFNELIDNARESMQRVKQVVAALKQQDVALEKKVMSVVNPEVSADVQEQEIVEERPYREPKGFAKVIALVMHFLKRMAKTVVSLISRAYRGIKVAIVGEQREAIAVPEPEAEALVESVSLPGEQPPQSEG